MASARPALVDAHIHLWDLQRLSYAWLTPPFSDDGPNGNVAPIARTYLLPDYLADTQDWRVEGAVHVDAGAAAGQALDETRFIEEMAAAAPFPLVHVAYAALDAPDVEAVLEAQAANPVVRGVRQIVNWHPDPQRTYTPRDLLDGDPAFARGFAALARHGLSFDLQIYPHQMRAAAEISARHPHTPVILNHAGMPTDRDEAGVARWRDGMRALAALPQAAVKLSGFGIVDPGWTVDSIRPWVLETIDLFGADRAMFASDVPTDKLHASFDRIMDAYAAITADASEAERAALFGGNARRIYRIDGQGQRRPRD